MNVNDLYEQRNSYFIQAPALLRGIITGGVVIGLVTLVYGFASGNGTRVWGSFLFNLFFFFLISFGAMAFVAIQDSIGALWARPMRRIQEAFGAFVPLGALLFAIYLLAVAFDIGGAGKVYSWIADPTIPAEFAGKDRYLTPGWMYTRTIIAMAVIVYLVFWQFKHSLRRDQAFIAGRREEAERLGLEGGFKLRYWSAPILVVYGMAITSLTFDLTMSLAPAWFSTLWGGWQFSMSMQSLMASTILVMFALKSTKVGELLKRHHFHDVGKLMHGFTIFFAYLTYAHVLTYWYANMPEHTEYYLLRLNQPWLGFIIMVPIIGFVLPLYAMVFKGSKWTAAVAVPLAALMLLGQWVTHLIVVMPEVVASHEFGLPIIEVGLFLGMAGLFGTSFFWFAKRFPMIPLADPLLARSMAEDHH